MSFQLLLLRTLIIRLAVFFSFFEKLITLINVSYEIIRKKRSPLIINFLCYGDKVIFFDRKMEKHKRPY